jgi:predicted acetyltransferase
MSKTSEVTVLRARASDAPLLANLLELYIHDLSAVFTHVRLGADGRYGYPKLPLYWTESERRFPFLIRCAGEIAGFSLVTRGSPVSADPEVLDVAEFFVLRAWRGRGVGRRAAFRLWREQPGRWTVRVASGNTAAIAFWTRTVEAFTGGQSSAREFAGEPHTWRVFEFESR